MRRSPSIPHADDPDATFYAVPVVRRRRVISEPRLTDNDPTLPQSVSQVRRRVGRTHLPFSDGEETLPQGVRSHVADDETLEFIGHDDPTRPIPLESEMQLHPPVFEVTRDEFDLLANPNPNPKQLKAAKDVRRRLGLTLSIGAAIFQIRGEEIAYRAHLDATDGITLTPPVRRPRKRGRPKG